MNEEEIINQIALQQETIENLRQIRERVFLSDTENIRIKIETKHKYGYSDPFLTKEKHKIETTKYTMQRILDEAIKQAQVRISKLIDMEIERRKLEEGKNDRKSKSRASR